MPEIIFNKLWNGEWNGFKNMGCSTLSKVHSISNDTILKPTEQYWVENNYPYKTQTFTEKRGSL